MSTTPQAAPGGPRAPASTSGQMYKSCWTCRVVSGGGLILAGAYVFSQGRKFLRLGGPTSTGTVAQMMFAAGLAAWGLFVIADPLAKAQRKSC